jgi:hypothetical protein
LRQRRRVARFSDGDEVSPQAVGRRQLRLGLGLGAEANVVGPSSAP